MICRLLVGLLTILALHHLLITQIDAARPPGFYNKTNCLYAYVDEGYYRITSQEWTEEQSGKLGKVTYEDSRSSCVQGDTAGKLVMTFNMNDNNMESMTFDFQIKPSAAMGYWEINKAVLTIVPTNKNRFPNTTIEMKVADLYAGSKYSFSCSSLVLRNLFIEKVGGVHFNIKLNRFQLQPFGELPGTVFAPSYDCAVWLTMPLITGTILILFMVFSVLIGVSLLAEQGKQTKKSIYMS